MLGESHGDVELWDSAALVGHLVPVGSVFAFLAEHRSVCFRPELFADLFRSGTGRPSIPGEVIASVLVLQTLHDLSDREAMEALRCDLRWKVACGLSLTHEGYHPSVLTYWRRRLAASKRPDRVFEAVRQIVAETGVLAGKTRRALDSVVLDDAVATQDTVTQLIAAVRRVGREVPGAAEVIEQRCTAHNYSDPGKPGIAWDDLEARDALVSGLVGDAVAVIDAFAEALAAAETANETQGNETQGNETQGKLGEKARQALALLALVAGQDVEPAEGSDGSDGRWQIAKRVAEDRVISVVDPEARHVHKTVHHMQDGYKAHVVVEPDTGLFTAGRLAQATGADHHEAAVGVDLLRDEEPGLQVLGDTAYGTGQARAALAEAGHTPIIKPAPLRGSVKDRTDSFTVDDFTVDETAGCATCPAGVTRPISSSRYVTFGTACTGCPLRARCTTSKTGKRLKLRAHDAQLRQARRDWADHGDLRATYRRHRPMVERSISWLIGPKGRCRKLRYRGANANNLWLHLRMAALNLRRLLNLGLTRQPGTWALA